MVHQRGLKRRADEIIKAKFHFTGNQRVLNGGTDLEGSSVDSEPRIEADDGFDDVDPIVQLVIRVNLFFEHLRTTNVIIEISQDDDPEEVRC